MTWTRFGWISALAIGAMACGPTVQLEGEAGSSSTSDPPPPPPSPTSGPDPDSSSGDEPELMPDFPTPPECQGGRLACSDRLDVLVVVDNSRTMAEEQAMLARSITDLVPLLREATDANGEPVELDVQVMVTTTDVGNPACAPFRPEGYVPAQGAPISTACSERLEDFVDLTGTIVAVESCVNTCPLPVTPTEPFVAFGPGTSNVPQRDPVDIDGDGELDSPEAQALACLAPQGINGCGYESPLEAMRLALSPDSPWNLGDRPFVRSDAALAVVVVTDELDCSVADFGIMKDPSYYQVDPDTGLPAASSAICWNAGVECEGPDAGGFYALCNSRETGELRPVSEYVELLRDELGEGANKDVIMLPLIGVPPVVAHNPDPPFEPVAGGAFDLVHRRWQDGEYPAGDILPDELAMGVTAADKEFEFGIGPGCTGQDGAGGFTGQGIAPVRMLEVCRDLDFEDGEGVVHTRCCVESICDEDGFVGAYRCIPGVLAEVRSGSLFPKG